MNKRFFVVVIVVCISALIAVGQSSRQKTSPSPEPVSDTSWEALDVVKWKKGPSTGELGTTAQVQVPAGYVFAGGADTRTVMEVMHNPTSGRELGFVAPAGETWFAVFEFSPDGYVKDDEKDSLDADAILESIKAGTEASNKERVKRGWAPMTVLGWEQPPRYNETTHNLEWAIKAESEGSPVVNYNTRLLGRGGVMQVTLVTDPATLQETLPKFRTMLAGFDFNAGQRYSEFRAGDKVAAYGLTGLMVGGGAAVLAKSGVFKWLWKLIVAGVVGLGAIARKFFGREKTA